MQSSSPRNAANELRGLPHRHQEPHGGVGESEVDEGEDQNPAVRQPSHRLLGYQAPAVRASSVAAPSLFAGKVFNPQILHPASEREV